MKKLVMSIVALSVLISVSPTIAVKAETGYDYGNSIVRDAVTTRSVKLYKVHSGMNESKNKFHYVGNIKVGTKIRTSAWISSMKGYVVTTAHNKCSKHHFYFVKISQAEHWFK